jgi:hypothetical protein
VAESVGGASIRPGAGGRGNAEGASKGRRARLPTSGEKSWTAHCDLAEDTVYDGRDFPRRAEGSAMFRWPSRQAVPLLFLLVGLVIGRASGDVFPGSARASALQRRTPATTLAASREAASRNPLGRGATLELTGGRNVPYVVAYGRQEKARPSFIDGTFVIVRPPPAGRYVLTLALAATPTAPSFKLRYLVSLRPG